jgi:hypothetical protein
VDTVISFFSLRPTFTLFGLKVIWYAYLLLAIVETYGIAIGTYDAYGSLLSGSHWLYFLPAVLGILVRLALVRLLLEVAIAVLFKPRSNRG